MNKHIVVGVGALGISGVAVALFGAGVAGADAYAGLSYDDAASVASSSGQSIVIAARVGNLPDGECMVERSQTAPFVSSHDFSHASGTVQLYLNCTAAYAQPGEAGHSVASPYGKAARDEADAAAAAQREAQAQQERYEQLLDENNPAGTPTG